MQIISLLNNQKIAYFDEGSGFPILMIHGWVVCKESFVPLMNYLKNKYRCIALDLPGHGDSGALSANHNLENYLKVLDDFVNLLNLDKFHIFGSSLGATLALLYTLENPNKIERIIIQAPVIHWRSFRGIHSWQLYLKSLIKFLARFKLIQNQYFKWFENYVINKRIPAIKKFASIEQYPETEKIIQIIREKNKGPEFIKVSTEFGIEALFINLLKDISKIQNKTLILWGENDETIDKGWGLKLEKLMSNAKYVEVEKTSHNMIVEKPKRICQIIDSFLSRGNLKYIGTNPLI